MLIAGAEIDGIGRLDVRISDGRVAEIARDLERRDGELVLDANGGALLPGLHDHHIHLFALAAAEQSVRCGPPQVHDARALRDALASDVSAGGGWLRGVGYHESVAGELDRSRLDALVSDRPARIQHRSGALWILNSAGVTALALDHGVDAPGVERDAAGRATGRLYRLDGWLREHLESERPPDLAPIGRLLNRCGVTGVTDATPTNGPAELAALQSSVRRGDLPQRLVVMGGLDLPDPSDPAVERGAVKLMLTETGLPELGELTSTIAAAHAQDRPVAIHCVTRSELVFAALALRQAGPDPRDRIEHASVAPPDVLELLADLGTSVVTQPHFVRERGDAYVREVDPLDRPWLYRCRGVIDAGVPLGGGTDAPFGDPDPWRAIRAAVDRRTEGGLPLGACERLDPERALALFTSPASSPGAPPRRVEPGVAADLCLLDRPWAPARDILSSELVNATLRSGEIVWSATDEECT